MSSEFKQGIKDGIPIAIGYFSVSFSFGIIAVKQGISVLQAVLTSASNITSAGQFAGLQIIVAGGTILEMILTQFIVNLRYALMSLSLSQKLDKNVSIKQRLIMAFANTDEIFAAAMAHNKAVTMPYMAGLQSLPVLGWTFGTAVGAVAGDLLPASLCSALGLALYGMFVAIVVPAARKSVPVMVTVFLVIVINCLLYFLPVFHFISTGIAVIISTVAASAVSAVLFPVPVQKDDMDS